MKRGQLVTVVLPGAYGKPRPALILQSDLFASHPSVVVVPITSELRQTPLFRIALSPTPKNGLKKKSEIMIDKIMTIPKEKISGVIGEIDYSSMQEVNRCLLLFLGIAN